MNKYLKTLLIFLIFTYQNNAQKAPTELLDIDALATSYSARIENEDGLQDFFQKLELLKLGLIPKVSIVHIGDSHLQAGFATNETRKILQSEFGNAGQGLVFPYKLAKSNAPRDSYSFSNVEWVSYRNVHEQDLFDIGIKGYVIATLDPNAILKISVNPKDSMDYSFDKISIFHPQESSNYHYKVSYHENRDILEQSMHEHRKVVYKVRRGDYLGKIASKFQMSIKDLKQLNKLKKDIIYENQTLVVKNKDRYFDPINLDDFKDISVKREDFKYHSEIGLEQPVNYFFLTQMASSLTSKEIQIDGILLEKSNVSGLLYNMIGVNGAMYSDYNKSELFFKQLSSLNPDLIIVSLGTNEISNQREDIQEDMRLFFQNLSDITKFKSSILITTPIDYKGRANLSNQVASDVLDFARTQNMPYYNLYDIFGGKNSIRKLQGLKLAQRDGIHLNADGYRLQGFLFAKALLQSYNNYLVD